MILHDTLKVPYPYALKNVALEDMYKMKELFPNGVGKKKWDKVKHLTPFVFMNYAHFIPGIGGYTQLEGEYKLHEDAHCGGYGCWMCKLDGVSSSLGLGLQGRNLKEISITEREASFLQVSALITPLPTFSNKKIKLKNLNEKETAMNKYKKLMDKFIDKTTSDTAGDAVLLFAVLVLIFQLIRIVL